MRALSNPVRLESPEKGVDGRTTLAGARAPTAADGRIGDFWVDTRPAEQRLYGPKNASGWPDLGLIKGNRGWSPVFAAVVDGSRRVQRVIDWQGGEGTKPTTGQYVGATGLVATAAEAVDIRGPQGPAGPTDYALITNKPDLGTAALADADDFATAVQGEKAATALQPAYNFVARAGNYLGVGQQADFDGFGKGGLLLGGGSEGRGSGAFISLDGHRNWVSLQSSVQDNPTEFIIYSAARQGYAQTVAGGGTITRLSGAPFDTTWEAGDTFYFLRKRFKIASVPSANSLTVTEMDGSPVVFPIVEVEAFSYLYTTGQGVCDIVGDRLIWRSGDPFVPLFFRDFRVRVNGVVRTVAEFISPKEWRLSSAPGNVANVPFAWRGDIFDQLSTLRVQAIAGSNEENVNLYVVAGQEFYGRHYALRAGVAGANGQYRPIYLGSGAFGGDQPRDQVGLYPDGGPSGAYGNGYVSLGGVQGLEAMRVYNPATMSAARNRIDVPAATSGFSPSLRAVGVDSDVGFGLDLKGGASELVVTQDFARTLLKVRGGAGAVNFAALSASATGVAVTVGAEGSDANIDLALVAKGSSGRVRFGTFVGSSDVPAVGTIEIRDAGGTIRKVMIAA